MDWMVWGKLPPLMAALAFSVSMRALIMKRILSLLSPAFPLRGSLSTAKQFTPVGKSDASPKWSIFAVAWAPRDVVNFRELRKVEVQLRRIPIPRTTVNKGKKKQL